MWGGSLWKGAQSKRRSVEGRGKEGRTDGRDGEEIQACVYDVCYNTIRVGKERVVESCVCAVSDVANRCYFIERVTS